MVIPDFKNWCTGISNGDKMNYTINSLYHHIGDHSFEAYHYNSPQNRPDEIEIDQNGLLSISILDDSRIFDFVVQVRDDNGLLNRKNYQVPAEILFEY